MARRRKTLDTPAILQEEVDTIPVSTNEQGERMSVFEALTHEEWIEQGAGSSARKGEYSTILADFAASGQRYAMINTNANGGGRFAGKKASSVSTALKQARDGKNAPDELGTVQISSKSEKGAEGLGLVFLENTGVEA